MKKNCLNIIVLLFAALMIASCMGEGRSEKFSGKEIYIPNEFSEMNFNDTLSRYCFQRMDTTANIAYFWEKGFGTDISTAPGQNMDVLTYTLHFYQNIVEQLQFSGQF